MRESRPYPLRYVYQTDDVRVELWANTPEEMEDLHDIFCHMCNEECEADGDEDCDVEGHEA